MIKSKIKTKLIAKSPFDFSGRIDEKINTFLNDLEKNDRFSYLINIDFSICVIDGYTIQNALIIWKEEVEEDD